MAKTKAQLRTENSNNFPNNNSQFITPEKLRGFNNDIIDSVALEANTQLSGTGSFSNLSGSGYVSASEFIGDGSKLTNVTAIVDTGSLLVTASFDNGTRDMTFTKGDSSTFTTNIPGGDTGSLIETASVSDATITFTKADASQFSIEVNNVSASIQAEDLVITVKNESGVTLPAGTAVKATGVVGENITIVSASADNPSLMPAIGVLNQELSNNATGECYIAGRLENIDTSNLVAGAAVYVNNNGGLTSTKPTGSSLIQNIGIAAKINATEGELVIQGSGRSNDVPNIPQGQIWVGNSSGVATPTSTGSFAKIDENNTFTGTQNFNNISVSGTGSFGYIESVTGSAKIIGDAFLILNNDTPTERYAGIKVIDSGSSGATASLQFDGSTNDWFYEYTASGDPTNHGVVLFGPEYGTIGSPTYLTNNTIPKGNGGHHLNDSNISDDGTTVSITGDLSVSGTYKGFDSGSFAILNQSNTFTGGPQIASGSNGIFTSQFPIPQTGSGDISIYRVNGNGQSLSVDGNGNYTTYNDSLAYFEGYGRWYDATFYKEMYGPSLAYGAEEMINGGGMRWNIYSSGSGFSKMARMYLQDDYDQSTSFTLHAQRIGIGDTNANAFEASDGIFIGSRDSAINMNGNTTYDVARTVLLQGTNTISGPTTISGDLSITSNTTVTGEISSSNFISASAFIGDGSQLSGVAGGIFIQTGSYYSTTNDLQVTGSFGVNGGIGGKNVDLTITSQTASVDLTLSNTFTVTLTTTDTHLDISTFGEDAQSMNLLVKQPTSGATGSLSFSPDFKFGQGYTYVPTSANSSEDIISFTRFGNFMYGTFINNFS